MKKPFKKNVLNKIINSILLILLTSCSIGGDNPSILDDVGSIDNVPFVYIKWKIKRYDYNYEPWDYVYEYNCGWFYDEWMKEFDKDDVCVYYCMEQVKNDYRRPIFNTLKECEDYGN